MKTKNKALLTLLCAAALVAGSVFGTYAYLTAQATVTNTFTVGKVAITLHETKTDEYGVAVSPENTTDTGNEYKLIPGHTYTKDPTIRFIAESEQSYLFVKVIDEIADIEDATTIVNQITTNGWTALDNVSNVYYKLVDANLTVDTNAPARDIDYEVFENFKIKTDAEVSDYSGKSITVTAYAVQADGFATAEAAWNATFGAPTP